VAARQPHGAFTVYSGNRLETLARRLAELLDAPPADPMAQEVVLVQHSGMARWLSLELAAATGVCAHIRFVYPNAYLHELFGTTLTQVAEQSPFEKENMVWRVAALLGRCMELAPFAPIRDYLHGDGEGRKRFQVASHIAAVFDRYLLFRPEMIANWCEGRADHWQATLWRELASDLPPVHRPALHGAFFRALESDSLETAHLPERLSVFGVTALPPFHMSVLQGLSRLLPVTLFHLNPCRHYWADIVTDREMGRILRRHPKAREEDLHLDRGNALLASMGAVGRDFFSLLQDSDCRTEEVFERPETHRLLGRIQADMLDLEVVRKGETGGPAPQQGPCTDGSLGIHACHSALREVEVLYDLLLSFLDEDPDLEPQQILVMTPDMKTYGPLIEAVFNAPESEELRIPFTVAETPTRRKGGHVDAFFRLLDLCRGRFEAQSLCDFIHLPPVCRRFSFSEAELETISHWIRDTRIRWATEAADREKRGLPAFEENTWKAGLARLLLGYALPGGNEKTFCNVLPYDLVEAQDASTLGRLVTLCEDLFCLAADLARERTLLEWAQFLGDAAGRFLAADPSEQGAVAPLTHALLDLGRGQEIWRFEEKVGLGLVLSYLGMRLEQGWMEHASMKRGVTFCSVDAMRGVPFRVIVLLGMNGDLFPRKTFSPGFDLMARFPRPGDRSRTSDDRYLFLETLLSARKKLHITYVGQGIQDNRAIPPSPLVGELIDYLERRGEGPTTSGSHPLVTRHRLQAFHGDYFRDKGAPGGTFSYSRSNVIAARKLLEKPRKPVFFDGGPLPAPDAPWKEVALHRLRRFYTLPARFLLEERLGLVLESPEAAMEAAESFELIGLERYEAATILLEGGLKGEDLDGLFPLVNARGLLPHGKVGRWAYQNLRDEMEPFVERVRGYLQEERRSVELDLRVGDFRITGLLRDCGGSDQILYRPALVKPKDLLAAWLSHLVRELEDCGGTVRRTILIGRDDIFEWDETPGARSFLEKLLALYWEGLTRPLPFFPESSWAYAEALVEKGQEEQTALEKARRAWQSTPFSKRGEDRDPYTRLCFGHCDPLDEEFRHIALGVFEPLMAHRKRIGT